jgi:hypothetical protein
VLNGGWNVSRGFFWVIHRVILAMMRALNHGKPATPPPERRNPRQENAGL